MSLTENYKKIQWEKRSSSEQHYILMYLYRVAMNTPNLHRDYIEAAKWTALNIQRSDLPLRILAMGPEELYKLAYSVIGKEAPTNEN